MRDQERGDDIELEIAQIAGSIIVHFESRVSGSSSTETAVGILLAPLYFPEGVKQGEIAPKLYFAARSSIASTTTR